MGSAAQSTFRLKVHLPEEVDRDAFFARCWAELTSAGLLGVHEGTVLSAEAADHGLETESWTLDAAEAPRERDWIGSQAEGDPELYFASHAQAEAAREFLASLGGQPAAQVEEQLPQDWDADWKASFRGILVPPHWKVIPPWVSPEEYPEPGRVLRINPGAGFGTGTHETTQLCLELLSASDQVRALGNAPVLDFGSGSGILALAAAMLGARPVDAVEIDELAIDNAVENARLNDLSNSLRFARYLPDRVPPGGYRLIFANILRPVLIEFAPELIRRLSPGGDLVLSGLIESDVAEVVSCYSALLGRSPVEVRAKAEWRGIHWA